MPSSVSVQVPSVVLSPLPLRRLPVCSSLFGRGGNRWSIRGIVLLLFLFPFTTTHGWIVPQRLQSTTRHYYYVPLPQNTHQQRRTSLRQPQLSRPNDSLLSTQSTAAAAAAAIRTGTTRSSVSVCRLHMSLIPLPVEDLEDLLMVGSPSGQQYATYWGRTKREKYNQLVESTIVAFIGTFFSYFLSFVVGGLVSTIIGTLFFFWAILSPDFKARQRNWEFLGGRPLVDPWMFDEEDYGRNDEGLFGSLLLGRVDDVCVVEDTAAIKEYDIAEFQDYTPENDELEQIAGTPYLLRLRVSDDEGRELQVHARLLEEYLGIEQGMPASAIVLSTSQTFSSLAALTDIYIPDEGCFVGDYPYLNPTETEALFAEDDDLWEMLRSQAYGGISDEAVKDNEADENVDSKGNEKVLVRRRRRRN